MNILRVSHALFKEFSQKYGVGEERKQISDGSLYLLRELNPKIAGFTGAIGLQDAGSEKDPCFRFVLWGEVPRGKSDVFEPRPRLTITVSAEPAGVWVLGKGQRMAGKCRADFSFYGLDLYALSSNMVPMILQRAFELVSDARNEVFWEKDKNPEGDFSKPSR